jgi:hypothetical protein
MTLADAPVAVGDILAGKYRVERLLGVGGMGVVVEAMHIDLQKRVALKFLKVQGAADGSLRERFLREARAAVHLRTQHVTQVSDVGTMDGGAPYMVMELLDGRDLDAELLARGPLPIAEAVEYVLQACEAVAEAHRAGIVHRDLKPGNLFLTTGADGSPMVKVLDFGVSKFTAPGSLKLTVEGQAVGSPLYMSPEQLMGQADVDTRSDLWALGVILYELVAGPGRTPFHAETLMALNTNILVKPPAPLSRHRADVPPSFEAVLLGCFEKKREHRYQDVAAFAAALVPFASARAAPYVERVARVRGVTVVLSPVSGALPMAPASLQASEPALNVPGWRLVATTGGATSQPAGVAVKRRTGAVVVGVAGALVALVLGGIGVLRWRAGTAAPEASGIVVDASIAPPVASEAQSARSAAPPAVTPAPATAAAASASASAAASASSAAPAAGVPKGKAGPRTGGPGPQGTAAPDIFSRGTRTR